MSDDLLRKIDALEQWKADALSVMPPLQEIAKELNVPLGVPIYDKILPGIQKLKKEVTGQSRHMRTLESDNLKLENERDKLKADLAELQAMVLKFKRAFDIAQTFNDDAPAAEIALSASFHEAMQHDVLDVLEKENVILRGIIDTALVDSTNDPIYMLCEDTREFIKAELAKIKP